MNAKTAAAVVALLALAAAPAALAKGSVTIDARVVAALHGPRAPLMQPVVVKRKDLMRSCQVGASRSRIPGATEAQRKAATVACEQPPYVNLDLFNFKAIQAAAFAATR